MLYPEIKLNPKGLKKFFKGHLWLTQGDIENIDRFKKEITPGSLVSIHSPEGYFLAQAYFNPHSYYTLKILTREKIKIDETFFYHKFREALALRKKLYPEVMCFRLIHAEGDNLPGLIIDLYKELAVVQIYTLGMERLKKNIHKALTNLLPLKYIVFKNNFEKRKEEDLPLYIECYPKEPEDPYFVEMDSIKFLIPIKDGQKTGFFLDQKDNRRLITEISKDLVIVDAFSYIGGFSFYALKGKAKKAILIDRSAKALNLAIENAKLNGWSDKILPMEGDVFKILKEFKGEGDILILDPPAFIKTKQDFSKGKEKYKALYHLGFNFFSEKEGFLFLFSCSQFFTLAEMGIVTEELIRKRNREIKLLKILQQSLDHPVNPLVEETFYLKGLWIYIS